MATDSSDTLQDKAPSGLRRWLREPMLHFLFLAGLIFLGYALVSPPALPADSEIVVTSQDAERLTAQFRGTWNRDPSAQELDSLIEQFVREEIFYREARSYGLDQDDQVVRVRMRQKMEFLLADPAAVPAPTEAELRALFAATEQKYVSPETIAFRQVFLGEADAPAAEAALLALQGGADPALAGAASLLPSDMALSRPAQVDGIFGDGFFARISALPLGAWSGPVRSAYGLHLVQVAQLTSSPAPQFEEVRASVEGEWRRDAMRDAAEAAYQAVKARYRVDLSQIGVPE